MTFPDPIGALALVILNLAVIWTLWACMKVKIKHTSLNENKIVHYIVLSTITIIMASLILTFFNMILIYPLYFAGTGTSWKTMMALVWGASLPFTIVKLIIVFTITAFVYPPLNYAFANRKNLINNKRW
jgi:riboflavin transporter FmnP